MYIKRDKYLNEIISKKNNGLIKVITGLRRSGKTYLLFNLYYKYLLDLGIKKENIITFAFDTDEDIDKLDNYLPEEPTKIYDSNKKTYKINSKKFRMYINDITNENEYYYLLLDEIQNLDNFIGTLNGFIRKDNFDTYVTGSNSRFLSKEILTEFRGRGDQIHVLPLSFKEYYDYRNIQFDVAYKEYSLYGGMPLVNIYDTPEQKSQYLKNLFEEVYIKDIINRNNIQDETSFNLLLNTISSSIGSYTNSTRLENTFKSEMNINYSHITIGKNIDNLIDAFLINKVKRYDIKGKKYINSIYKYYFTDLGLRNARLNFRQIEPTHIMENIIYNELIYRGYNVDIGIVETYEKNENNNNVRKQLEIDFIVNNIDRKYYIQSCYSMPDKDKYIQESKSLINTKDNFKKIIIVNDNISPYISEDGIEIIPLKDFLLGKEI